MTDMPERVWLKVQGCDCVLTDDYCIGRCTWVGGAYSEPTGHAANEYVRADLVQAQINAAVAAERERCMRLRTAADQERG